ncbi:MAG: type I secretion system permease/ATPase [Hyphomonadaceae bacterium JAD_PAG50586_4]|nr:MAG: type I secretion system permease/ATPase [Hyphomonadaceae bacterium JAD_PAG50586_4]
MAKLWTDIRSWRFADAVMGVRDRVGKARAALDRYFNLPPEDLDAFSPAHLVSRGPQNLRTHVMLILGFSAAINLLYLAPSLYMLQVYDRVIPTSGVLTLVLLSVVLLVSLSVLALLDSIRSRLLARASVRVERLAADIVIEAGMRARRAGGQPEASSRDLDNLRTGITSPAAAGLLDLPWTPLFILICFVIHFWIGVLAIVGAVIIMLLALANERSSRDSISRLSGLAARFYSASESDLGAAETIHALGANTRFRRRRAKARADFVGAQTDVAITGAGYSSITKATRMLLQSAALGLGAFLAVQREISPGAIIAATILTARAFAPVEQIVGGWRQLGMAHTSYLALRKLFSGLPTPIERTPLPLPQGKLDVEQISATAPDGRTMAIQGVSFQVEPGDVVGVIGPSGAGKTALARVLANAATPRMGAVRLDGARYGDWEEEALASHIGYLPQRIELFDGTIADNIASFAPRTDENNEAIGKSVVAAAIQAGAHDLILRLPRGYETELGPSGSGISPGQAQRIALARALFNDPCLLVLDEPNSHLDQEGEAALAAAIQGVRARGGVVIVVAHRAGIISIVDKLLVMRDGRLVEYGPRQSVVAKIQAATAPKPTPVGAR